MFQEKKAFGLTVMFPFHLLKDLEVGKQKEWEQGDLQKNNKHGFSGARIRIWEMATAWSLKTRFVHGS